MTVPFTPGPWTVSDDGTIESAISGLVAHIENASQGNIRLIEQAPALFACLNQFLREHDALCLANDSTEDRWPCATWARHILQKVQP